MAARSDAATDHVTIASAPAITAFTVCAWVKIANAAAGSFNPMMRVDAGGGTALVVGFKGTNGRTPSVYSAASSAGINGTEVALSTYVFIAATRSGTTAQLFQGTTPGSLTKVSGTVNSTGTPSALGIFGRAAGDNSEWLDGTMAYFRVWTNVLSDAELASESQSATPVRTTDLWADWRFAAAALTDSGPSGRTLTAGTTALAADTDPVLGTPTDAGTAALTLGATGTQARIATAAGIAGLTLAATGIASALRAAAGTTGLTLGATGVSTHVATGSGLAGLALGGDGTALHIATDAGTASLTLFATGTVDSGEAVDTGTALLTLGATGLHTAVRAAAGNAPITLDAVGVHTTRRVAAGTAVLELIATGTTAGDVLHTALEPRLTIRPNLATLVVAGNAATLSIDQGGT